MLAQAPTQSAPVRIGELSVMTGCSVPTIRYYEDIGLIPKACRSGSGQRLYGTESAELLQFIRRCRDFDFSINQIKALVSLTKNADRECSEVRDIAKTQLAAVREKLGELKKLELSLSRFIVSCNTGCIGGVAPECSIFKDIAADKSHNSNCCVTK